MCPAGRWPAPPVDEGDHALSVPASCEPATVLGKPLHFVYVVFSERILSGLLVS